MGKPVFYSVGGMNAVETTPAVDVSHLEDWSVLIGGTFVGTLDVEVSFDAGATWVAHPDMGAQTAPVVIPGAIRVQQVRGNMSAWTSGQADLFIGGTDNDSK